MAALVVDGKTYDLEYSLEQLMNYERAGYPPVLLAVYNYQNMLSVTVLMGLLTYGLKAQDGDHLDPEEAGVIAGKILMSKGADECVKRIMDALRRDCGFLFKSLESEKPSKA